MFLILSLAMASTRCFTEIDIKTAVCLALCKHDGYDTGLYLPKQGKCVCGHEKSFAEYTEDSFKIVPPAQWRPDGN